MPILKFPLIFIVLLTSLHCSPQGAVTPEEAFALLKKSYISRDAISLEKIISTKSRKKIKGIAKRFALMDESQMVSLSKEFGISKERLRKLSVRDYLSLQLTIDNRAHDSSLKEAASSVIIGREIIGKFATLHLKNGIKLRLEKEGPYWKFNMDDL